MFDLSKFRARHIAKKTVTAVGALVALAAISLSGAQAAPITIPTGLNPGDTYRLAFVTSTARDATSLNGADYDNFVTAAANSQAALAALGTTWTAIASVDFLNARNLTNTDPTFGPGTAIYTTDGAKYADDNADLWNGWHGFNIRSDEQGNDVGSVSVWTGSDRFGQIFIALSAFSLGSSLSSTGWTNLSLAGETFEFAITPTTEEHRFYAISDVITVQEVTPIPEPSALTLFALGLAGLGLARRKRRT